MKKNALVVGLGYWGNILYKNLISANLYNNILKCDIEKDYKQINLEDFSDVFVATPVSTHFEICSYFLNNKKNVFCEKPLTNSLSECLQLYEISKKNNCILFVDWIYLYNYGTLRIKEIIQKKEFGNLNSITFNRYNEKILRINDVTCKWDLSCHDVSILCDFFEEEIKNVSFVWNNYTRLKENDSVFGFCRFNQTSIIINNSWNYGLKDRVCLFDFENGKIIWDDGQLNIKINKQNEFIVVDYSKEESALKNSIKHFYAKNNEQMEHNKKITLKTINLLEQQYES